MTNRILIKAVAEIDGRLAHAEAYAEPGQSVVPMIRDGELSLTVKCKEVPIPTTYTFNPDTWRAVYEWMAEQKPLLDTPESDVETWLASKVAAKFAKEQAKMSDETGGVRRPGWLTPFPDGFDREEFIAHMYGYVPPAAKTNMTHPKPAAPVTQRVLFDGYPLPHVIGHSVAEGWVDVLLHTEDGEPIWDASKQAWKAERLCGDVKRIEERE